MWLPLGPVLAKLYMAYYEQRWLQLFEDCEVLFYRVYVDQLFVLLKVNLMLINSLFF